MMILGTNGKEGFVEKCEMHPGLAQLMRCSDSSLTAKFNMGLKTFISFTPEKVDRMVGLLLNLNLKMKSNWP